MFRTFVLACFGFVAFAVIIYLVVVIGVTTAWDIMNVHDQDGGGAMALGLVIGPLIGLLGGLAGAYVVPAWASRRRRNAPPQTSEERARDIHRFIIIGGAVAGGFAGHYFALAGFRLVSPISIDSYWKVWAISWVPTIVTLFGALAGGLTTRRWLRGW